MNKTDGFLYKSGPEMIVAVKHNLQDSTVFFNLFILFFFKQEQEVALCLLMQLLSRSCWMFVVLFIAKIRQMQKPERQLVLPPTLKHFLFLLCCFFVIKEAHQSALPHCRIATRGHIKSLRGPQMALSPHFGHPYCN